MQDLYNQIVQLIGAYVPNLLGAIAILVVGWLVALLLAALFRGLVRKSGLDKRLALWIGGEEKADEIPVARYVGKTVYYLALLFVLIAFFQALGLTIITEPLNQLLTQVFVYAPQLLAAGLLLLLAWGLASFSRLVISKGLGALKLDEKLGEKAQLKEEEQIPVSTTIANAVYWLIFLLFLPAILGSLKLQGLLGPIQGMIDKILAFMPNLFTAAIILLVGWFVASIIRRILSNLFAAVGLDRLTERAGLTHVMGEKKLSEIIGLIVYIFILIPIIISALETLALESITMPATNMLNMILASLPALFAASLIIVVAYIVGKILSKLVGGLLSSIGFDNILIKLGLSQEAPKGKTPSEFIGYLVLLAVIFFASIEALRLLDFGNVADLVSQFTVFAGHILLGLIIFGIGLFIANLVADRIKATQSAHAQFYALLTRVAILLLVGAMALQQMGFAEEVVIIAFGVFLGSVAIAIAVAFGVGGRDMAARQIEEWMQKYKSTK
jgi:hypothetical protein